MPSKHTVLWDGTCGMCSRAAAWMKRHDQSNLLIVMPYQDCPSPPMTADLAAACDKAVHVIRVDGTILRGIRAVLLVLEVNGWGQFARLLSFPPFVWPLDLAYRIIAANRPFFARFMFRK